MSAGPIFPWRRGNRFELLIDGPLFFPRMLAAIDAAQHQVDLEQYLIESGACTTRLVDALCAAAERGVPVRCLFDDFGCQKLLADDRQRLLTAGVVIRWYNPLRWRRGVRNLYRDHRKLLVVDGEVGFVGGTGSTDQFWDPAAAVSPWHEVMVAMAGPLVADWQHLFDRQWQACHGRFAWRPRPSPGLARLPLAPAVGTGLGRVAYADAQQHRDILQSLVRAIRGAQQRIWLATPYFLPTWKVRRALRKAASRGVEVRLLLSGQHTDNPPVRFAGQRYYPRLLKAGVQIFEYQPRFMHLKMVLIDDWVSVGSCNFDHWNLRFNLDANLEALDPELTAAVAESLHADFAQSEAVTLAQWRARPLWRRVQQRLWGWLDRLVVNVLDRRR
ncbi:Phosphatidylserine/phosphatidylglycerophosphate/cardiolipin synthase [Pseudomonas cuatrocienegasensis]|uniref:Phosphatidylserine/phosphatidylglycerophosphate/cardiolipin synthase n=1 Tax=Pseudomonas cuatrocienegasensis TaxID=543360 RepID=A0ABY1BDC5_9PSED|nr:MULTISPECIES: phosphatidylserine/phosphatidylglycerophosphate/cardiolipin synthase family protein [Pseudomonas]OEC33838.1 cardiolipin synthase B [Pseudomonas sp. 21C1]SEQ59193.1 Phosphatidylserine/phosphatidylglycerophosphate/cardiolipin synthase [Pseudomonas cuatrocienegasensis]